MKQTLVPLWQICVMALAVSLSPPAQGAVKIRISESICLDRLETVPATDDLMPILIAADVSCKAPSAPISI